MDSIVWIVLVAIAVIALIAVIAMMAKKKKAERDRTHAAELREKAAEKVTDVQRREAMAKETEAEAAAARAEAERRSAEAQRLEAEAQDRAAAAAEHREEHQQHLRRADELDPDVKHPAPTTASTAPTGTTTGTHSSPEEHTGETQRFSTGDSRTTDGTTTDGSTSADEDVRVTGDGRTTRAQADEDVRGGSTTSDGGAHRA